MPQSYSAGVFGNPDLYTLKKRYYFFIVEQAISQAGLLCSADMIMGNR